MQRSNQAGTIIGQVFSGFLSEPAVGAIGTVYPVWPRVFYIFGGISVFISILWLFLVFDTPEEHPYISEKEKQYLFSVLGPAARKRQVRAYKPE
ncbi:unnamed protein product [Protopolystoma xenopodis]|uniref:Major facilitator superfamily (MFS) profile domain-containing protein n=1 Tax=Protopolystoma xenopodis TaxID=117903 RepID=A0A448WDR0_9PLAT|nr:unnamed protein product [Protopolystoma xenopodis]